MSASRTIAITVRGRLSARLVAAFDGLEAVDGPDATCLVGEIADQAQLHGLLARIRDLGLELESVAVTDDPGPRRPGTGSDGAPSTGTRDGAPPPRPRAGVSTRP